MISLLKRIHVIETTKDIARMKPFLGLKNDDIFTDHVFYTILVTTVWRECFCVLVSRDFLTKESV